MPEPYDSFLEPEVITNHAADSATVLLAAKSAVEDVRVEWGTSPTLETVDGTASRASPASAGEIVELRLSGLATGVFYYRVGVRSLGSWIDGDIHTSITLPERGTEYSVTRDADPHLGGSLARRKTTRVARIAHCVSSIAQATDAGGRPAVAHFHLGDGVYSFYGSKAKIFPIAPDGQPLDASTGVHCAMSKDDTDILVSNFVATYAPVLSTRNTIMVEGNHEGFWTWLEAAGNVSNVDTATWTRESVRERLGSESGLYGSKLIGDCLHCWANTGPGSSISSVPDGPPFLVCPEDRDHHSLSTEQFDYFFDPVTGKIPNHTGWVEFTIHQKVGGNMLGGNNLAYGRGDVAQDSFKVDGRQCYEQAGRNALNPETGQWEYGDRTPVAWSNPFGRTGLQETHGLFGALVEMLSRDEIWGIVKHEGHDHCGQMALVDGIVCVKHSQTGGHHPEQASSMSGFKVGGEFLLLADRPDVVLAEWDNYATWGQTDVGPDALTTRIVRSVYFDPQTLTTYEMDGQTADGGVLASVTLRRPDTPVDSISETFDRIVDDSSPAYSGSPGVDGNRPPPVNESARFYTSGGDFWAHGNSADEGADDERSFLAVRDSVVGEGRVLASRVPVTPGAGVTMWMRRALAGLDRQISVTVRFDGSGRDEPTVVMVPIHTTAVASLATGLTGKGLYLRFDNSDSPSLDLRWDDGVKDISLSDTADLANAWVAPIGPGFDAGLDITSAEGRVTVTGTENSGASPSGNVVTLIDKPLDSSIKERIEFDSDVLGWTGLSVVSKNMAGAGHVAEFGRFRASRLG